nr:hypothetical protein [Pseudomonadota bacterium]
MPNTDYKFDSIKLVLTLNPVGAHNAPRLIEVNHETAIRTEPPHLSDMNLATVYIINAGGISDFETIKMPQAELVRLQEALEYWKLTASIMGVVQSKMRPY